MKQILNRVRSQIDDVYRLAGLTPQSLNVSSVTVILGSSRSGSSLLFHLLSQSGGFVTPQAEETPLYRLAGQGWVTQKSQSDEIRIPVDETQREMALDLLASDLGGDPQPRLIKDPHYLAQSASRLLWQWPQLELNPERVLSIFTELATKHTEPHVLWMEALEKLDLEVGFYDLPGPKSRNLNFEIPDYFIEEPPFVIQQPRTGFETTSQPLLLKTSTNAYRIPWLKTLFAECQIRFIVLTRNPAAAINGLMDGWLSSAFHSHNLQFVAPLKIKGYTEQVPFGDRWWKFDLPPNWSDYDDAELSEVCAFQWRSAYARILEQKDDVLLIKSEELTNPKSCPEILRKIFEFSKATPKNLADLQSAPLVMASQPPAPARWRARESELWPLIQDSRTRSVAESLGYAMDKPEDLL